MLRYGGAEALKTFLNRPRHKPFPPVYVVDDAVRDILGRKLEEAMWQRVRGLYRQQSYPEAVRRAAAKDGQFYLLFVVLPKRGDEEDSLGAILPTRALPRRSDLAARRQT